MVGPERSCSPTSSATSRSGIWAIPMMLRNYAGPASSVHALSLLVPGLGWRRDGHTTRHLRGPHCDAADRSRKVARAGVGVRRNVQVGSLAPLLHAVGNCSRLSTETRPLPPHSL